MFFLKHWNNFNAFWKGLVRTVTSSTTPLLRSLQQGSNPSQQQLGTQLCGVPYPKAFTYQRKQLAVTHPYDSSNSLEVNSVKTLTHLFVMQVVSYVSFSSLLNLLKFALWTGFWRVQVDTEQFRKHTGSRASFKILFFWAGWFGSQTLSGWLQARLQFVSHKRSIISVRNILGDIKRKILLCNILVTMCKNIHC